MITLLLLLSPALLAQGESLFGPIPEGTPTFSIERQGKPFYFALRVDGEWLRDAKNLPTQVEVWTDAPWLKTQPKREYSSQYQDAAAESVSLRKNRLARGWKENDFVFVETITGIQPVKQADQHYALRAREMSENVLAKYSSTPTGNPAASQVSQPGGPAEAPSGVQLWGGHAVLVLLCVVLGAVVIKTLVLQD